MFFFLLLIVPLVAWWAPWIGSHDSGLPIDLLRQAAASLLFFFNGMQLASLQRPACSRLLTKQVGLSLVGSFLFFPLMTYATFSLLHFPPTYWRGLLFLSLLPTTTNSCIAFCQMAGGPLLPPLLVAIIGNGSAILLLPLLLPYALGIGAQADPLSFLHPFLLLMALLLLPLWVGWVVARWHPISIRLSEQCDRLGRLLLVYIIYTAYCTSFLTLKNSQGQELELLFSLLSSLTLLLLLSLLLAALMAWVWQVDRETRLIWLFTMPQKSVVVGVPLASLLMEAGGGIGEGSANWSSLVLPLLLYNNVQNIVSTCLAYALSSSSDEQKKL